MYREAKKKGAYRLCKAQKHKNNRETVIIQRLAQAQAFGEGMPYSVTIVGRMAEGWLGCWHYVRDSRSELCHILDKKVFL